MADEARVTQAGRQAAAPNPAGTARVTQAGRQAAAPNPAGTARVTQAGRQAAAPFTAGTVRVTQLGRNVLNIELRPNTPNIITPNSVATYQLELQILHAEAIDPVGGTTTHTFRYRKTTDTMWTTAFTGRAGADVFYEDISALADGTYEAECWATNVGGSDKDSFTATVEFEIDNSTPSPPFITAPVQDQVLVQGTFRVEWEAAIDPNDDALTYNLDYRAVGAGSWTSIDTGVAALFYDWNMSALGADDYEIRVIADDGTNESIPDERQFSVTLADQPLAPIIRITAVDANCVTVEILEYAHPTPRAWASTTYEIIPVDGDFANPVVSYTTTDPNEQFTAEFCDLAQGFEGYVRVKFTDDAANDSFWSEQAQFQIGFQSREYVTRWDVDAIWTRSVQGEIEVYGLQNGIEPLSQPWLSNSQQRTTAAVDRDSIIHGSAFVTGLCMFGGRHYGLGGLDTELRDLGVGIFTGFSSEGVHAIPDFEQGVAMHLDVGTADTFDAVPGLLSCVLRVEALFPRLPSEPQIRRSLHVDVGEVMIELVAGYTNTSISPVGPWVSTGDRKPWYRVDLLVTRNVGASPTTRIRGRVHPPIGLNVTQEGIDKLFPVPEGGWHIDVTYPLLGPCGQPGYVAAFNGRAGPPVARTYFRGLEFKALRDEGLPVPTNLSQAAAPIIGEPPVCIPQAEAALPAPVFFPVPPNGDVIERTVTPTDIISAWDETEQRIALRERPIVAVSWLCTLPTSREMGDLHAMIYEDQPSRWGVPLWHDMAPLVVDLSSSSGSIPAASVDTLDRRFEEMTHVALWVDQFTWDFSEAVLENDGSITLTTPTTQAFTGGAKGPTFVVPCRVGRMPQSLIQQRHAPHITDLQIEFILEAVNDG